MNTMFENISNFWVGAILIILIVVLGEVLKSVFRMLFKPLKIMAKAQRKKAIRDKFAAHALQGLISWEHNDNRNGTEVCSITDLCQDAYNYADRMMDVRKVKDEKQQHYDY